MSFAIRKIIQEEKPEIVHAHNWLIHSFLPLKNWSKAKLVVTFHDYHLQCAKWIMIRNDQICTGPQFNKCLSCMIANYGSLKGILTVLGHRATQKLYANSVDMFIPVSQAVAEGNHLPQNQLPYKVISNFIPDKYPQEQEIEDYLEQLPQKEFMLFVGAFSPLKGFDILLEAYRIIETDMPLVFIGYELNEYALAQYDVPENVYFLKHWPNPAVMEAWKRSAIGIVPSTGPDSSPTVVMEAMYGETPVIGTQVGGIPDIIIDGETGILIPHNNIEALRKAIQVLLDNPERRKQMGKRGKQHVEKFQASFVVGEIEAIYHQLKINN
jgi:glycosyltransferase involved in cell wall biosynthesis